MLNEARLLLSRGISVIPVKGRTASNEEEWKKPVISWKDYQTRLPSMSEVVGWFRATRYNMAIVTGQVSRLLVLDIDERHSGKESIQGKALPLTWHDKSPGGEHYYFRWHPAFSELSTQGASLLPGLDVRGNGGYIICPPSIGYGNQSYEWIRNPANTPLAYPPSWFLDLLKKQKKELGVANKQGWIGEVLANVKEGNRDNSFIKLAGRFWHDGLQAQEIIDLLTPHAERVGYGIDELIAKVKQVEKYPRAEAISIDTSEDSSSYQEFMGSGEKEIKWIVDGIVPEQGAVILGGTQGLGKTWLLLDLAIELARGGGSWLGKFGVNPAKVLYVDEESSETLLRTRLSKLVRGKGLVNPNLDIELSVGRCFNVSSDPSFNKLRALIDKTRPKVIFIDSLVRVHSACDIDRTAMATVFAKFKKLIREFDCSIVIAAHTTKQSYQQEIEGKEPSSNDIAGSNEITAFMDGALNLVKRKGELYIYQTKSRYGIELPPFLVKITDPEIGKTEVRAY